MDINLNVVIPVVLTILSIIGTFWATRYGVFLQRRNELKLIKEKNHGILFLPIHFKRIHQEFYDHFEKRIKNAKTSIYITGRGLIMEGPDRQIALDYISSFRRALERNKELKIVRIQYGENVHEDWYKEFKQLKASYPERLTFYVLDEESNHDMVHVAAIDPDDEKNCIAEIMVPSIKLDGDVEKEIAGSAIFIDGNIDIAQSIRDRILRNCKIAKRIETPTDFDELMK